MTPLAAPFPATYDEARGAFLRAAREANARISTFTLEDYQTAEGEPLCTDVAYLGPAEPARLLVTVSGTHGIEGFCGSTCQTRVLLGETGLARLAADSGTGMLLVHALNPYGFAYLRRVNEENVDVNRNFVDHDAPPHNDPYDKVHDALTPQGETFDGQALVAGILPLREEVGERAFQQAVTQGQYRHADGLFYGGREPSWSQRLLRTIVAQQVAGVPRVGYIDLHTGLGPRAVGEPIFRGGRDPDARERAEAWYGPAVTASEDGSSSSTPIVGNTATAVADGLHRGEELTAITLEFGTQPGPQVLLALCADNWLHLRRPAAYAVQDPIKSLMREAFAPDADADWRTRVLDRAREVFEQAFDGLSAD